MLITVEGKKSHQVQKSKAAVTQQRHEWHKGMHKGETDLRHVEGGMMQHLTRESVTACTDRHLGAGRGGHRSSRSCGWQLLVSQTRCLFCTPLPSLFKSIWFVTQSPWKTCSSSVDFQGLTVTGKCSSSSTDKEMGHEKVMWGTCPFTNNRSAVGLGTSCVFLGLHFIHWDSLWTKDMRSHQKALLKSAQICSANTILVQESSFWTGTWHWAQGSKQHNLGL